MSISDILTPAFFAALGVIAAKAFDFIVGLRKTKVDITTEQNERLSRDQLNFRTAITAELDRYRDRVQILEDKLAEIREQRAIDQEQRAIDRAELSILRQQLAAANITLPKSTLDYLRK